MDYGRFGRDKKESAGWADFTGRPSGSPDRRHSQMTTLKREASPDCKLRGPAGLTARQIDLRRAFLRYIDQQAQRFQYASFTAEVLPDFAVYENRVLKRTPQIRIPIRPDGAGEILFGDLFKRFCSRLNRCLVFFHRSHVPGVSRVGH